MRSRKSGQCVIVGVPIGNYSDLSPRAAACLKSAGLVLCEDTRESGKLLLNLGVQTRCISYIGSFNAAMLAAKKEMENGNDVALISDRGMPCISDPGADIIKHFRLHGFHITCIPGASAATTAFALTGYAGPFIFHGFLPRKRGDIIKVADKLRDLNYHIIFFEAPNRVLETLTILSSIFPGHEVTLARELTKTYQEVLQFKIEDAPKHEAHFKGECVIIIKHD